MEASDQARDPLPSWRAGTSKQAVQEFVERVTTQGSPEFVAAEERVATFDNDGTLWCEKPMPIQLDFILRRLAAMADQDPGLRTRQPWQAAHTRDYGWLGQVITRHYQGDDRELPVLAAGILEAFAGITVDEFEAQADAFLARPASHPGRGYLACAYAPRWSCWATWRRTGSPTTSPRVAGATSCGRSARRCTGCPVTG